jgi:tetratricopeptide (TPR) repeat protein
MTATDTNPVLRCSRCGRQAQTADKFCAECGQFLRDAYVDHRLMMALDDEVQGRSREARGELVRLLDGVPDHVLGNHILGTLYFHDGMLDLAIERYKKAVAGAPTFVLGYYDLGVAWYHRGNMPEAIAAYRRCLEIDPNYYAAHYRLALALFHAGELDDALRHFELSTTLTPEYLMAHYHMGVIYERKHDLAAAAAEFERSLAEGVGEVSSLHHMASIRRINGDELGAEDLLRRAREFGQVNSLRHG